MPSAKRRSAGESGCGGVSGAADASRFVPTGAGESARGAMVSGVMVMVVIIAALIAMCGWDGAGRGWRADASRCVPTGAGDVVEMVRRFAQAAACDWNARIIV